MTHENNPTYFRYWGKAKAQPTDDEAAYHLLPYHALDVAAVASLWWDASLTIQHSFMQHADKLSISQMKAWVIFFIALHDYGKFDIRFQRKAMRVWEALQPDLAKSLVRSRPLKPVKVTIMAAQGCMCSSRLWGWILP